MNDANSPSPKPLRGYADGPYGQIHYRRTGAGEPLVLLHQAGMNSGQFDAVYPLLAARSFDVIGIDMPGFGMSDAAPFVPRVEDLACCVPAVLDALELTTAAIAGHHTGAMTATEAALQFPGRVRAVVLHGPMPITEEERQAFLLGKLITEQAEYVPRPGGAHFTALAAVRERFAAGTVPTERISDYILQAYSGQAPFWHGHNAGFRYRHEDSLARLVCPALILTNTGDQIYANALRARALRPDLPFIALEGGGIDIVDQQPAEWSDAVATFLGH
jgi:pimeloyl-ACP methyl ester carboxylesterase